jgi:hypothetical protein
MRISQETTQYTHCLRLRQRWTILEESENWCIAVPNAQNSRVTAQKDTSNNCTIFRQNVKMKLSLLACFPYFEEIKSDFWDHLALCLSSCDCPPARVSLLIFRFRISPLIFVRRLLGSPNGLCAWVLPLIFSFPMRSVLYQTKADDLFFPELFLYIFV